MSLPQVTGYEGPKHLGGREGEGREREGEREGGRGRERGREGREGKGNPHYQSEKEAIFIPPHTVLACE